MKSNKPSAQDILRGAGLKKTAVRLGVLELLARSESPLEVPQILGQLPKDTDAVTVYRTLNTFTRKKLVHRIHGQDRAWKYALSHSLQAPPHQHPHFVCQECGKVQCIEEAVISPRMVRSLSLGQKYTVSYAEVLLHGICSRCQA